MTAGRLTTWIGLSAGLVFSAPAAGLQVPVDLAGGVAGAEFEPLPAALVTVGEGKAAWTAPDGRFTLKNVPPGEFRLSIERAGYQTRAFNLVISDTAVGVIDLGVFALDPVEGPTAVITGSVRNVVSNAPLAGTFIVLNGVVVASTDDSGAYAVDSVPIGLNQFEARRVGYLPTLEAIEVKAPDSFLVDVRVQPLPIRLDDVEVVAEGDRTIYATGRLGAFYRRRRTTPGTFFEREDIEKHAPFYLSDVLRRVPGVRLAYRGGGQRPIPVIRGCRASILLDGMEMQGMTLDDIPPEWVEAIEVHRGASVPVELIRTSRLRTCGVIAVWTR